MKKVLFNIILLFAIIKSNAQPYQVGNRQQTFIDTSRSNRQIPCEIYYPSTTAGTNTPIASGTFPVLVFGHGFVMTWSAYDIYWETLVPHGYIMVFPTTETSLAPSHSNFGKDIAFLIGAMKAEGNDISSPFYGSVDVTSAVMGHSMGGGSAFLATQYDSSITALATVAAAETNPSAISSAASFVKPSLVFAGANDCVTPPPNHQVPMYDSLGSTCKTYISITGGNHCQFASYNFFCSFGQATCSPQATINDSTQQGLVFSYLLPWLNFYLKYDCASANIFQSLIATGNGITSQQNCSLICNVGNMDQEDALTRYKTSPNPFTKTVTIETVQYDKGKLYVVTDLQGRQLIASKIDSERTVIDFTHLPDGMYILAVNGSAKFKIVKQK